MLRPDKSYKNIARHLIGSPYTTSALIDWADVVFHLGTGVIFESFIKEKLTVFPSYASANTAYSELYGAGVNLSNRDQLRDFCNQLDDSVEATKTYYQKITRDALELFNQDFVNGGDQSIARRINEVITKSLDST